MTCITISLLCSPFPEETFCILTWDSLGAGGGSYILPAGGCKGEMSKPLENLSQVLGDAYIV